MGGKPFLLFGRKEPLVDARKERLKELDSQISEKQKALAGIKHESASAISEAQRMVEKAKSEENALKALRNEVNRRIKLVDSKEARVRELEHTTAQREKVLQTEEVRIQGLKKEELALQTGVSSLEKQISEKQKALADIKRESVRLIAQAEQQVSKAQNEDKTLQALRTEVSKRVGRAEKEEAGLREMEKRMAERESALRDKESRAEKLRREEESLRAAIASMEHAFDEKKSALDERQRTIVKLSNEIAGFMQKRADIQRLEAQARNVMAEEQRLGREVEKKEKLAAQGAKVIADQQEDIEKYTQRLNALRKNVAEFESMKKQLDDEVSDRQKVMLKAKRELADMETAVKDVIGTKDELQKRAAMVAERERRVADIVTKMEQKKGELERLQANADSVGKSKRDLAALVEDKMHVLADLKQVISQNSSTIKELHERELGLRKAEHELKAAQHDIEQSLKALQSKDKEMARKEAVWIEHDKLLKEATRALATDKKVFEDEVRARKAELLLLQQEWDKRRGQLKEEKESLQSEKADVRTLVETDVTLLKDKEDEMVEAIAMFEHDRKKLEEEEKSLLKRVAELERAKAAFEREQKGLNDKEKRIVDGERVVKKGMEYIETERRKIEQDKDQIYRARELKKMLPQLEHKYEELRKSMDRLRAHVMETGTRPAVSRVLKEREKELAVREKGVEFGVRKLMEREHEVEALEQRKEKAFKEYLREEVERVEQGKPGREIMNPEIHAMIDDAREKVMRGQLDDAVRLVSEAEYLIDKLGDASQKRLLMYDVRDLKTSIKLATLT